MRRSLALVVLVLLAGDAFAQRRPTPARRPPPAPPAPATKIVTPEMTCPAPLGTGVNSALVFCDVLTARDPSEGILIDLPDHAGPVTLRFDLHNRQTYSEEQVKRKQAFARYTASIGAMMMNNTLISRAVIQSEFRSASDLVDRISGGAGAGGLKAVAPTGVEHISIDIPETEKRVSLLGEKLLVERLGAASTYSAVGRPIAIISNVTVEYRPLPAKPATAVKPATRRR